ncbi:MAG: HlyD family efflux transporter periplasmic adaptor subunit [Balneolaceae bacterium]|nr:HlyD family efflux transporter periplasmic adaptor subunit [Balneolaceae bacterium]
MLKNPLHNGKPDVGQEPSLSNRSMVEKEDLEVRSTEVQEIIGRPPHWLVRSGISAFLVILMLVFLSASVIKYPEVIQAPLQLRAINEPKVLQSNISGQIIHLPFNNNTQVEKGEVLAWLESTASHQNILDLSETVDSMKLWLEEKESENIRSVDMGMFTNLGELQTDFQNFEHDYREFIDYLPGGFYSAKRKMLENEMRYTKQLLKSLQEQKKIQEINLRIAQAEYAAQKKLAEKDLVAPMELAQIESKVAAQRLPLQQTESAIINNYATQTSKDSELIALNKQIAEQQAIFRQSLNTLQSTIDQWKKNYLITSPVSGKLIYAGIIQENQNVKTGQELFYVKPPNSAFFGEMAISQRSYGKIEEGQKVLVNFSGYPEREFGSVTGKIDYFSEFPVRDSVFLAKVNFPNGLNTNYGQKLSPANGMIGTAEIVTRDMRFLERIYNNITKELR